MARLLLLPVCLGDTDPASVLPADYLSRMRHLRAFFVEDLRSARRFLRKIGYTRPFEEVLFVELNEHVRAGSLEEVLLAQGVDEKELSGQDMGVLSEAGLPCVADPGALAVDWAQRKGVKVVPFSGPSSLFLALMASGLNGQSFCFNGYLPASPKEREAAIREIEAVSRRKNQTQLFIETPYRSQAMFESLVSVCHASTQLCVASNITLPDESILTRTVAQWRGNPASIQKKNTVFLLLA